jgi:hypothetical protein
MLRVRRIAEPNSTGNVRYAAAVMNGEVVPPTRSSPQMLDHTHKKERCRDRA